MSKYWVVLLVPALLAGCASGLGSGDYERKEARRVYEVKMGVVENVRAVRTDKWKYIERVGGPTELYDLEHDPGEQHNFYGIEQHEGIQEELRKSLRAFFAKYASPEWDLWHGGGAKGGSQEQWCGQAGCAHGDR